MSRQLLKQIIQLTKKSFTDTEWWKFVHPDIQLAINNIIDNIDVLGLRFRDAFVSMYKYEHTRRLLNKEAYEATVPGAFENFPEECYQSGITPTKVLFNLHDWARPQDVDIIAAFHLCGQIDILEEKDFLVELKEKEEESHVTFKTLLREILKNFKIK